MRGSVVPSQKKPSCAHSWGSSPTPSIMAESQIPLILPELPPATCLPWSADVVEAHRGLVSAFRISRAALNLDESDPIRLGHHLQNAEVFMLSIVEVLSLQTVNPLPPEYIEAISNAITLLVDGLRVALRDATTAFVSFSITHRAHGLIPYSTGSVLKYHIPKLSPYRRLEDGVGPGR